MITLIDALNFRCLRNVRQPLDAFHVLVGANASGKTTFLDVVAFLGDVVATGLDGAVERRSANPTDLVWSRQGTRFELAIEARVPEAIRGQLASPAWDTIRYEIAVATEPELAFDSERVLLQESKATPPKQLEFFPSTAPTRESLLVSKRQGVRTIINKVSGGNDNFYSETYKESGKGWQVAYKLGPRRSALANLPEDETAFPAATWLKGLLASGVQAFVLNSLAIRRASPPGQGKGFKTDGSNLPWVVADLEGKANGGGRKAQAADGLDRLSQWLAHVRTALPDLAGIRTVEREDDKHRYLVLKYQSGIEVPSWMASDGTLRLLALTLPAYLDTFSGVYLIEEPENGIHPRAVEAAFQSLSSVYNAQILVATHSPVILSLVEPHQLLCFAKTSSGETCLVRGSEHPALAEWRRETNLGTLFAAGVLG